MDDKSGEIGTTEATNSDYILWEQNLNSTAIVSQNLFSPENDTVENYILDCNNDKPHKPNLKRENSEESQIDTDKKKILILDIKTSIVKEVNLKNMLLQIYREKKKIYLSRLKLSVR